MVEIYDSIELALTITALLPCLILIILYLMDCSKLKYPNYFKLELMIVILCNICLSFVKKYNYKKGDKCEKGFKIIGLIQSYVEMVINCLLASFNYLCYILLKNNKINKKFTIIIILSLISWIIPIYIFGLYFFKDKDEEIFHFISGVCIFSPKKEKKLINLIFISVMLFLDSIFFILTILILNSKKEEDEDNISGYNKHIRRITINFISHLIFFFSQIFNPFLIDEDENEDSDGKSKYYNISYHIALTIISIANCFEGKTRDFYNKLITSCLTFDKVSNQNSEDEEEEEDDDDDEEQDMKIYVDSRSESMNNK